MKRFLKFLWIALLWPALKYSGALIFVVIMVLTMAGILYGITSAICKVIEGYPVGILGWLSWMMVATIVMAALAGVGYVIRKLHRHLHNSWIETKAPADGKQSIPWSELIKK